MLRQYKIFANPLNDYVAVKMGWSWMAFLFNWVWALLSKLWLLAAGLFIVCAILSDGHYHHDLHNLMIFGMMVIMGVKGNDLLGNRLLERGYKFKGTATANNKDAAIASFMGTLPEIIPDTEKQTI